MLLAKRELCRRRRVLFFAIGIASTPHSAFAANSQLQELVAGVEHGFDEGFGSVYREHCAVCHGDEMLGTPQGTALVDAELTAGASVEELIVSISKGEPSRACLRGKVCCPLSRFEI